MKKHHDFRKPGVVSLWIGYFDSEAELDDYINLSGKFEKDFGFELNERDMPETSVVSAPVGIPKLIEGFSWSDSYAPAAVELARKREISQATTLIVFFNFEYQPALANPRDDAPLIFLGSVPFS